jgi:hypothetical protein
MAPKYVKKNPRVLREKKSAEQYFMKFTIHSSTEAGGVSRLCSDARICTVAAGTGIVSRDYFTFYFFSLGEQIKIFDRAPLQAQKRNKK